jgi:hypothetical protein
MEGVGGSAGFADRTAYCISLRSHRMANEVYLGKDLGVQTYVASPELIQQYLAGIGERYP